MSSSSKITQNKNALANISISIHKLIYGFDNLTSKVIECCSNDYIFDNDIEIIIKECEHFVNEYFNLLQNLMSSYILVKLQHTKRKPSYLLECRRYTILLQHLHQSRLQYLRILNKMITIMLQTPHRVNAFLEQTLSLMAMANKVLNGKDSEFKYGCLCRNLYPSLLSRSRSIDMNYIIEILGQELLEIYSMSIINSIYAIYINYDSKNDNSSHGSSLEIMTTLTSMSSPIKELNVSTPGANMEYSKSEFDITINAQFCHEKESMGKYGLQQMPDKEDSFVLCTLARCATMYSTLFVNQEEDKNNIRALTMQWVRNSWRSTENILDHLILWWNKLPLTSFGIDEIVTFRHWLHSQALTDVSGRMLSTMKGLFNLLTAFVCNITWDQNFRRALVEINSKCMDSKDVISIAVDNIWLNLFVSLSELNNSMQYNNADTKLSMLPLSEQVLVLHRVDHSVHFMRLWAREKAKLLCQDWNMATFFNVIKDIIEPCLNQMKSHIFAKLNSTKSMNIYVNVCIALRQKLISEVQCNIELMKTTSVECIQIMASFCRTSCMALLVLCFPHTLYWKKCSINESSNDYVKKILNEIYLPVLMATTDIDIIELVLKIICESWLDFIFLKQIKFSVCGAVNLLNDFNSIRDWIENCTIISAAYIEYLSQHESLRMCVGVGKILLRKPDDIVSILKSPLCSTTHSSENDSQDVTKLPPEMFVPNQESWLKLRHKTPDKFYWPI